MVGPDQNVLSTTFSGVAVAVRCSSYVAEYDERHAPKATSVTRCHNDVIRQPETARRSTRIYWNVRDVIDSRINIDGR